MIVCLSDSTVIRFTETLMIAVLSTLVALQSIANYVRQTDRQTDVGLVNVVKCRIRRAKRSNK